MDGRFVVIVDTCKQCHSSHILRSVIKPMDLLYFAFQFYLNLRLAAFVSRFLNLMQTWWCLLLSALMKEYLISTTYIIFLKFAFTLEWLQRPSLCSVILGSTYHRFQFYATDWGVFIRRKLCFGCRQSYHIWRVDKTSLVGLVFQFVFLKYRSSSTTDFA